MENNNYSNIYNLNTSYNWDEKKNDIENNRSKDNPFLTPYSKDAETTIYNWDNDNKTNDISYICPVVKPVSIVPLEAVIDTLAPFAAKTAPYPRRSTSTCVLEATYTGSKYLPVSVFDAVASEDIPWNNFGLNILENLQ